jgi:Phosphoenolpyruvate synthase/pyruvate phosphate dikinase
MTHADKKYIYFFEEGSKDMKMLLGGKGAGLAEMTRIGLRTPPGLQLPPRHVTIISIMDNFHLDYGKM